MGTKWLEGRQVRLRDALAERGAAQLPLLARLAECAIRFLFGAVLAAGQIFEDYAPFGVAFTGASGAGINGFCALAGVCLGYFLSLPFSAALKYAAASILTFSIAFAFGDVRLFKRPWFMPAATGLMTAVTGFVYLTGENWSAFSAACFVTEVLLAGCAAYFYRVSLTPEAEDGSELARRQQVSHLILAITLLIPLARITPFGVLSIGRTAAALVVMLSAYRGGIGLGSTVGVAAGFAMDLAGGGGSFHYSMLYGLSGLLCGVFSKQGRLFAALVYVSANATAAFWTIRNGMDFSILYEVFVSSVAFMVMPDRLVRQAGVLLRQEPSRWDEGRRRGMVGQALARRAAALRAVHDALSGAFSSRRNDSDVAKIFDRAANTVCRKCALWGNCWQKEYIDTFNALNDATPPMQERGRAAAEDFPVHFTSRCLHFPAFLAAVNEELRGFLYRRRYKARLQESRGAVCRQYGDLADILEAAAAEASEALRPDPEGERRLRGYLRDRSLPGTCTVYLNGKGRLCAEIEGIGIEMLQRAEERRRLSALLGVPLRAPLSAREGERLSLTFWEEEPYTAVIGVAACRRDGERVSGDAGTYFKTEDGILYIILSDGMGSGPEAAEESNLSVRLLERFLRSGIEPESALKTLNAALALRWEEEGGFSTMDLLSLDLFTGSAGVYKYGAAPSYVSRGKKVSRITCGTLPAGLSSAESAAPDKTRLSLAPGDLFVLVSDGIADEADDLWLRQCIAAWEGTSPKDLAQSLLETSQTQVESKDDRTALVLMVSRRGEAV